MKVAQGLRYRVRIIHSGTMECPVLFTIDDHSFTIIASDGENIQPIETKSLVIQLGKFRQIENE